MKKAKIICITILLSIILIIAGTVTYYFNNYDSSLVEVEEIKTDSNFENIIYNNQEDIWNEEVLGILTIEKIGLTATVKEGSNNKILKKYIGHIEETAIYDGNIGLARSQ